MVAQDTPKRPHLRTVHVVAVLSALILSFFVFALRFYSVFLFGDVSPASGLEGAAIFGSMQMCRGANIYAHIDVDPNGYIFGYLFFKVYSAIFYLLGDCGPSSIVRARVLSGAGVFVLFGILWWNARKTFGHNYLALLFFTSFAFFGAIGFWVFAIRPDFLALLCSVVASSLLLTGMMEGRPSRFLLAGCLFGVATALKQPFAMMAVAVVVGTMLSPMALRTRLLVSLAAVILTCAGFLPLLWPEIYLHSVQLLIGNHFSLATGLANIKSFLFKASPVLLVFVLPLLGSWGHIVKEIKFYVFIYSMSIYLFVLCAMLSFKFGASDNYFFPLLAFLLAAMPWLYAKLSPERRRLGGICASSLYALLSAIYLSGVAGELKIPVFDRATAAQLDAIAGRFPGPRLIVGDAIALPMQTRNFDVRVLDAYAYERGIQRMPGGIQLPALIAAQTFSVIAMPPGTFEAPGYKVVDRVGGLDVLVRD